MSETQKTSYENLIEWRINNPESYKRLTRIANARTSARAKVMRGIYAEINATMSDEECLAFARRAIETKNRLSK